MTPTVAPSFMTPSLGVIPTLHNDKADEVSLDPHIGVLLTNLQLKIEKKHENEIQVQLGKIEALNNVMEKITDALQALEEGLSDTNKTEIDLTARATVLDELYNVFPDGEKPEWLRIVVEKNKFTRGEAETLSKTLGRQIEHVARKVNLQTVDLNQAVEKRHEILQISRELLKMFREMMKTFTHNQRAGM